MNKFDLKDRLDKFVYKVFNFLSMIVYSLDFKSRRLIKKNVFFKDIHDGERCFILGTGPSLNSLLLQDRQKLKNEVLFGVNSFCKAEISSTLVPKYYALVDEQYRQDLSGFYEEVLQRWPDTPPVFISDYRAQGILEGLGLSQPSVYLYAKRYPTDKMTDEITENIYVTMNVISNCILVASYMGFKEIYLLGCDYNAFCTLGNNGHCYEDSKERETVSYNLAFFLKFYWITTEFHYMINRFAKSKGIKVVNLTPNSLLDAYPRASVSSVL